MKTIKLYDLPAVPDANAIYHLLSVNDNPNFYYERTNRHSPFITKEEQSFLRTRRVGVAGCGGMGGYLCDGMVRLGVNLCLTDNDKFERSNLNRQAAATMATIGKSKAFSTAKMVREVANDGEVIVFPKGITEKTVRLFCKGCHVICDEIEFWNVGARMLLHKTAREEGLLILTAPSVEYLTYLSKYGSSPKELIIEEVLGFDYPEAVYLQNRINKKTATMEERIRVFDAMMHFAAPDLFQCLPNVYSQIRQRALEEGSVPIVATNPRMASGFLGNHVVIALLEQAGVAIEKGLKVCPTDEIYKFDCGRHISEILEKKSWEHRIF